MSAVLAIYVVAGCVSGAKYDAALKDTQRAKAELNEREQQVDRLNRELQAQANAVQERENRLSQVNVDAHNLQTKLDEATAIDEQLRQELQRLGKNVDQMLAEKGTMAQALAEAKARLEELRKAQAATEARTALYRQLLLKFKKLTDSGQLQIAVREGRVILLLANDVLFGSGQAAIKAEGQRTLTQVAAVMRTIEGRRFQVAGYTDNVPSSWELSTARALAVVRFLSAHGVPPVVLSAAGYGEYSPLFPNDTPEHKSKNRRIEISFVPNVDELISLPDVK